MARYEHLPIYQKAMELSIYLQDVVRNFSRYDKYTIGADLELPRMYRFMKSQVNFIKSRFEKNHVFFIRIGRYIELYDDDALLMNSLLKLRLRSVTRGMHQAVGFLPHKLPIFDRKILDAGYNTVFIEEGEMGKYIRQRYVKEIHCLNHDSQDFGIIKIKGDLQ